jgi:hypothetical protein
VHGRTVRLFAAILIPPDVVAHLDAAVASHRDDVLRWTASESWHLTLAFYGQVEDTRVPDLKSRLTRTAKRHPTLSLALTGSVQSASPLDWMRGRYRADALARPRSCGRRSASRRVDGRKSVQSPPDPRPGADADGPSAIRVHLPHLSRPKLDRRCRGSGPVSPWCRRESACSVRDAVDPSAVRTGRELATP